MSRGRRRGPRGPRWPSATTAAGSGASRAAASRGRCSRRPAGCWPASRPAWSPSASPTRWSGTSAWPAAGSSTCSSSPFPDRGRPERFGEPQRGAPMNKVSWEPVRDLVKADRRGALVTIVAGPGLGAKLLVTPDAVEGSLGDPALDEMATRVARELLPAEEAAVREMDGRELFFDVFAPQPRLLIVGAVDFAAALARLAHLTGFKVSVIDARERFATTERIPDADEVVVAWPQEYLAANPPDDATYAAVLTHEPRFDDPTLTALLRSPVAYIGAMGSRRAHAERLERLREAGFGDDDIARISGPIGLDIGAKSPEETAVSILAEVIAARHGRRGGPLSERSAPVRSIRERGEL